MSLRAGVDAVAKRKTSASSGNRTSPQPNFLKKINKSPQDFDARHWISYTIQKIFSLGNIEVNLSV